MIIEISGLPEGQKIKNISVEVNFEDGVAEIKTSTNTTESVTDIAQCIAEYEYQETTKGIGGNFDKKVNDVIEEEESAPELSETKREPIPIPPEMTNQEF